MLQLSKFNQISWLNQLDQINQAGIQTWGNQFWVPDANHIG